MSAVDDVKRPTMSDAEVAILDRIFEERKPKTVLEWGSGGSTIYFPKRHPEIQNWIAVEHNAEYANAVRPHIAPSVELLLVPLEDYLHVTKGKMVDCIFNDGLMRYEISLIAPKMLNPGGCMILHDSGRQEYQFFIKGWPGPKEKLIDGELPTTVPTYLHRGLHIFTR